MPASRYMHLREGTANWQLRWPLPKSARQACGAKEWTKSLKTADRHVATTRAISILAQWQDEADKLVNGVQLSSTLPTNILDLCHKKFHVDVIVAFADGAKKAGKENYQAHTEHIGAKTNAAARAMALDIHKHIEPRLAALLLNQGVVFDPEIESHQTLLRKTARMFQDALDMENRRLQGEIEPKPQSDLVKQIESKKRQKAKPGRTLLEQYDLYALRMANSGKKRHDTIVQDRLLVASLSNFVGNDLDVSKIERSMVREWRDTLLKCPVSMNKHNEFKGLSLKQAAARAELKNAKMLSTKTVNKYLSAVSALYKHISADLDDVKNPCGGLFYGINKASNKRPIFSDDQIATIFKSPLFQGTAGEGAWHVTGKVKVNDWRFWIPLLCLFTGSRLGEIAQLRVGDIQNVGGIPIIQICHDEKSGLTTKTGQTRVMALHSQLVQIGLLDFQKSRARSPGGNGETPLFPDLHKNDRGQIGHLPSRFWRDYLTRIGIKSGGDGFGAHSFRHTIAQKLRERHYLDNAIAVALGHSSHSTTANYGTTMQGTAKMLSEMIETVSFEGLDLASLKRSYS